MNVLRLWRYARPYSRYLSVGLTTTVLTYVADVLPPLFFGWIIDRAIEGSNLSLLWRYGAYTAGAFTGYALFRYVSVLWMESWAQKVERDLRVAAFDRAQHFKLSYFDEHQTGKMLSVLSNDINQLERFLDTNIQNLLQAVIQLLTMTVIVFQLEWRLAAIMVLPVPLVAWATHVFYGQIKDRYRAIRSSVGEINARLDDILRNIPVVKAFTREPEERQRVERASEDYHDTNVEAITLRAIFFPSLGVISDGVYVAILIIGGYWVISGGLTLGVLTTFLMYTRRFYEPLRRFGRTANDLQRAEASAERIFGLMDYPEIEQDRPGERVLKGVEGEIQFKAVSFQYPTVDTPSLRNINVTVPAGSMLGVAGPTGSGKSTLTKLLLRFYDPSSGRILVDGQDIAQVTRSSLRRVIGIVPQETELFWGTVLDNILYGDPEASMEDVKRVVEVAGAQAFIEQLPQGYDTPIGEKGVKLSGGQRQRLAIARALLKDPKIMILDEATSAVDNETERKIQQSLQKLKKVRTSIVIAHRLTTLRQADQIIVIDKGQIVERGNHDSLIEQNGLYADLWWAQLREQDTDGQPGSL